MTNSLLPRCPDCIKTEDMLRQVAWKLNLVLGLNDEEERFMKDLELRNEADTCDFESVNPKCPDCGSEEYGHEWTDTHGVFRTICCGALYREPEGGGPLEKIPEDELT